MGKTWILDVLADLKAFAAANDLPRLASQLAATQKVAESEIAASKDEILDENSEEPGRDTQRLAVRLPA